VRHGDKANQHPPIILPSPLKNIFQRGDHHRRRPLWTSTCSHQGYKTRTFHSHSITRLMTCYTLQHNLNHLLPPCSCAHSFLTLLPLSFNLLFPTQRHYFQQGACLHFQKMQPQQCCWVLHLLEHKDKYSTKKGRCLM